MTLTPLVRLLMLAGLATPALAQAQEGGYFYGGLGAGEARVEIDQDRIRSGLAGNGFTVTGFDRDERSPAYRVFGGYQINRHVGIEAGYTDLGKFGFTARTAPAGALTGQIRLQGIHLDLVGTLPLGERFAVLGRIGAQSTRARDNFAGSGAVAVTNPNPSQRATGLKYGAGVQYAFSPAVLVRAEVERHRIDDAVGNRGGVNAWLLSLVFPLGRAPAPMPRMAAAPPSAAPLPEAAPAPAAEPARLPPAVVAAPVPPRRRVSFSAESLFDFDQATVKPEGKAALDQFVSEIRGTRFEVINVLGHSDRIGLPAYNQRLSMQRADAVKAYLVSAGGIDPAKVSVVAAGEADPVAKATECVGENASPKLIACLAPDRRVDIDLVGTR